MSSEKAIFAAGCFWGVQADFDQIEGVIETRVGYIGGHKQAPTYEEVCQGNTGHAEAIEITFDPQKVTYKELLNTFWKIHNPTTLNRQGPDIGSQYRSAIFTTTTEQNQEAEASKIQHADDFKNPIVTEVEPAETFWPAEDYHQKYFAKKGGGHCRI